MKTSQAAVQTEVEMEGDTAAMPSEFVATLGALLFTSPRPLTTKRLAELCETTPETIQAALEELNGLFSNKLQGFALHEIAGAWQFRTAPELAGVLQRLIPPRSRRLSRAAAETLAVIAYKQPVSRADIEAIRGVDAIPTLKTLLDARLIRSIGREDSAGHPTLYGTTEVFLEKYGLRDLSELPNIREVTELAADPGEFAAEESTADDSTTDTSPEEDEEEFQEFSEETK